MSAMLTVPQIADKVVLTMEPVAVGREDAAAALGVSLDHFDRHIRDELRSIKCGQRVLYAVAELRRWAERASDRGGLSRSVRRVA